MKNKARKDILIKPHASSREVSVREKFYETFRKCPIPSNEVLSHLGLFLSRQALSRIIYMSYIRGFCQYRA